jgi:hypothetical protein
MMHVVSFNEVLKVLEAPAQEEINIVSYLPLQDFDDALFYDLEREEVLEDPLNALTPSCYDEKNNLVSNIDEFIHVGRHKWDVIGYHGDPIYGIEDRFQNFHLPLSHEVTNKLDIWKPGHDMFIDLFQTPKDNLVLYSPNDFQSYLEYFDDYSSKHLDLFHEEYYQPPSCSDLDRSKDIILRRRILLITFSSHF